MLVFGSEFWLTKKPCVVGFKEAFKSGRGEKVAEFVLLKEAKEAVLANLNGVKYGVCDSLDLAKELQSLAQDYLFDTRILLYIATDAEFDAALKARLDGVIWRDEVGVFAAR